MTRATRILVVEDDPSIRMGLEDTLTAKGYEVEAVARGAEGVERALGGRFDLVVLDVMLPDLDGFEVCRRIRAGRDASRKVPVIMLSARGAELDRVRGLELGADDYVTKPFSLMELLARVARGTTVPSTRASRRPTSTSTPPAFSTPGASRAGPSARRRIAFTRATSSRGENGLVT